MVLPAIETDLVEATGQLDAPCRFLYKKENQQPSGSFKLRGMSKVIAEKLAAARASNKKTHVFCSSGGNAGLAAAYASKSHDVPCTVVLRTTSKVAAREKLQSLGAEVVVYGAHWGEADAHLRNDIIAGLPSSVSSVYCHPFDNEVLWDGHADMVDEISRQLRQCQIVPEHVRGIVCSCGGGGLYNGIVEGLRRNLLLSQVPVLVIETTQTPTFKSSVAAGELVTLAKIDTLSTSLGAPYIAAKTLENYNLHPTTVELIDDLDAVRATVDHFDAFGEVIEPACGATVAVSTFRKDLLNAFGPLAKDDVVIFVVCGGLTVSPETMDHYRVLVSGQRSFE